MAGLNDLFEVSREVSSLNVSQTTSQDDTDPDTDRRTGEATIVYEHPDEGRVEETVSNEQMVYVQDHWAFASGTDDDGNDLVRRVPHTRVYYVERNVEQFEEEVRTIRRRVESLADEVRQKLPVNLGPNDGRRQGRNGTRDRTTSQSVDIERASEGDEGTDDPEQTK